ncbi:MAG TPA: DHHA1 domain-containing protein, partial [Chitinophagaceae bacterium]|nr:DHHA1 domain-containing protein [Chitinophagaceae bacterium]
AGVRRIEALSGAGVEEFINNQLLQLQAVKNLFNNPKELLKVIENNAIENKELKKKIESFEAKQIVALKAELNEKVEIINNTKFIGAIVDVNSADNLKKLVIELKQNADVAILATNIIGKSNVVVMINEAWENTKSLDATKIIKEHIAPVIKGGGGGSKNIATAGGQEASNLPKVIDVVKALL